jgi:hypothetical protein
LKEGVSAGEYSAIVDKCREAVAGGHGLSLATVIHFAFHKYYFFNLFIAGAMYVCVHNNNILNIIY